MILNGAGLMVEKIYKELSIYFKNINFEEYVIMPNHFHCIIKIVDMVGVPLVGTQMSGNNRATTRVAPTIGDIIGAFKSLTTVEYIKMVKNNQLPSFDKQVWQRNYYENIIRNEKAYLKVMEYIKDNPLKWDEDRYR
jgi:REP element-mobilizing transposase RayT